MEIITTPKKKELLAKRGIIEKDDLLTFLPRKYFDYRTVYRTVQPSELKITGCFIGIITNLTKKSASTKVSSITFKLLMSDHKKISVTLLAQAFMYNKLHPMIDKSIAVCGDLSYTEKYGYCILNPRHIEPEYKLKEIAKIDTEYSHITGISQEYMDQLIKDAIDSYTEPHIDIDLAMKYKLDKLPSMKESYIKLHYPESMDMEKAEQRLVIDDMIKFAVNLEMQGRKEAPGTHIIIKSLKVVNDIINTLPYSLTEDQRKYFDIMIGDIRKGKRVSGLLQGDTSCGKTLVAILMLFAMAENGYQGVLMAPTTILASQHYEEIKRYGDKYQIPVALLDGTTKQAEKNRILKELASGNIKIIVGTQTLASGNIAYNRLGMVLIDEEHRFGVEQRNVLLKEAENGINTLLMSATPMPRTFASALHSNNTNIYDIHTMPSCRIPVQTAINCSDNKIFDFIESQLKQGRQAYVVCPLIEKNDESPLMENVLSVKEVEEQYRKRFEPEYHIGIVTGKMKEEELRATIDEFKNGNIDIIISTTVIEVGVNVPNASVMVISNAERFGLSEMHQLRGRVGRGSYKSYCILRSNQYDNERLNAMVQNPDGFSIAEEDLKLRGAGDLVGIRQSGFTKYMDLITKYPNLFQIMKYMAVELVDRM